MTGKSVLCIGIAVLDITAGPVPDAVEWKEKQRIERISLQVGGDGANQCIHLASLGVEAYFCGCIGADANGSLLESALQSRGVNTSLLRRREGRPTGTALLLIDKRGGRRVFSVGGAHNTFCKEELPQELPEGCGAVTIGSLFGMPPVEEDGLSEFLKKARRRGAKVFADLDSGHVRPGVSRIGQLYPMIDYLVPSDYDILPLTGQQTREDAAKWLLAQGVGTVIVKCGAEGCEIFQTGLRQRIPAPEIRPVDTTGAGDCMSAALIARVLAGDSLTQACRYACAAGSLNTTVRGASALTLRDEAIRALMAQSGPADGTE